MMMKRKVISSVAPFVGLGFAAFLWMGCSDLSFESALPEKEREVQEESEEKGQDGQPSEGSGEHSDGGGDNEGDGPSEVPPEDEGNTSGPRIPEYNVPEGEKELVEEGLCPFTVGTPIVLKGEGLFPPNVAEAIVYLDSIKVVQEQAPYNVLIDKTDLKRPIDLACLAKGWQSVLAVIPPVHDGSALVTLGFRGAGVVVFHDDEDSCYECNNVVINNVDIPFRVRSLRAVKAVVNLDLPFSLQTVPGDYLAPGGCPDVQIVFAPRGELR